MEPIKKRGNEVVPVKGGIETKKSQKNVTTHPEATESPEGQGVESACALWEKNAIQSGL